MLKAVTLPKEKRMYMVNSPRKPIMFVVKSIMISEIKINKFPNKINCFSPCRSYIFPNIGFKKTAVTVPGKRDIPAKKLLTPKPNCK